MIQWLESTFKDEGHETTIRRFKEFLLTYSTFVEITFISTLLCTITKKRYRLRQ